MMWVLYYIWYWEMFGILQRQTQPLRHSMKQVTGSVLFFAAYSLFAAIYAMFMTKLANKFGRKSVYMWSLMLGGIGLLSMVFIHDKYLLLISMLGIGIAWAAI